jgi:hypothetical protein
VRFQWIIVWRFAAEMIDWQRILRLSLLRARQGDAGQEAHGHDDLYFVGPDIYPFFWRGVFSLWRPLFWLLLRLFRSIRMNSLCS